MRYTPGKYGGIMINLYVHQVPVGSLNEDMVPLRTSGYPAYDMSDMDRLIAMHAHGKPQKYCTTQESHVLRLLRRVREGVLKPEDIRLFFYNPDSDTWEENRVTDDGDLEDSRVPGGFFDWRVDELF